MTPSETPPEGHRPPRQSLSRISSNLLLLAGLFEGGLGLLAIGLGWLFGFPLAPLIKSGWQGVVWGAAATAPMLIFLYLSVTVSWRPLRRLTTLVDRTMAPIFRRQATSTLLLIAMLAGVGEELFFRGLVQAGLQHWIGGASGLIVGLTVSSMLFGMAHSASKEYFIVTTAMGFYFGGVLIATDDLIVPVVSHALYDFIALYYFARIRRRRSRNVEEGRP